MRYYVGQYAEFSKTISEADVYGFAGIVGDLNPMHVNEIYAQESKFGKRIVHGILILGLVSTVLGMYMPGPGTIYMKQDCEFLKPVFIGETITAKVVIENIDNGKAKILTTCLNQDGDMVLNGRAIVKLPNDTLCKI